MTSTFTIDNTRIHFRQEGAGTPVLLLHGFGEDSGIFAGLPELLSPTNLVVLPDLPGSGPSGFSATICSSIDEMARTCLALMDSITRSPFVVMGHSMGGYIALAMAEQAPHRLQALGLLHSTAFADSSEKKETRRKAIGFIQENGASAFLKTAIPGLFSEGFAQLHPQAIEALVEKGKSFEGRALVAYYEAMLARPDRTGVLQQLDKPVLFVIGEFDKAAPMNDVLQQVPLPRQSQVNILHQSAHMGMMEEPALFNQSVVQFLNHFA